MKVRIGVLVGAITALGLSTVADAAPSPFKVTGGGQALTTADSSGVQGPGDTITFQAFIPATGVSEDSTGKVNIIDRTEGGSGQGDHFRGVVECTFLETDPATGMGYAELYGSGIKDDVSRDFVVRIQDNGQGAAAEADMIEFDLSVQEPTCEDSREDENDVPEFYLARGNAKIHKENTGASKSSSKSKSTSTTTSSRSLTSALTLR
jgi:hypothetical protein